MATHISRRDPFLDLPSIPALERMFAGFMPRERAVASGEEGALALDISEDDTSVLVRASLPGFRREDVHVHIENDVLSITARRVENTEETGERFVMRERYEGSVSRRVALRSALRDAEAVAELHDGVLTLRIPKAVEASARRIEIN